MDIHALDILTTIPLIAQKILSLDLESDEGEIKMLSLIENDPQIAGKIIGLANTSFFGSSKRITTFFDAAMLLGIDRVKTVTLGIAYMTAFSSESQGNFDVKNFWLHSIQVANAMRILANEMPRNSLPFLNEMFFAGLLHDIGYMVLNQIDKKLSGKLHSQLAVEKERNSIEIEEEVLELTHCQLGAELARHWHLPEKMIAVIRYHHDPNNEHAAIGQPLVKMVNLAEKILPVTGFNERVSAEIKLEEWLALGINPASGDSIIKRILLQVQQANKNELDFP